MRTLTCPRCRKPWEVDALHAGMKAVCPNCHASITISAGPSAAKPAPMSGGPVAATTVPATMAPAPATEKPAAAAILPAIVPSKVNGDAAIPAVDPELPSRVSVTPPATALNVSASPTADSTSEVVARANNEATEAPTTIAGPKSRRPTVLAAIVLLVAAGGAAAIWRPWEPRPEHPVVALPSNETLPIPPAIPAPSAIEAPSTIQTSSPPLAELPPILKTPSAEQKLPQATPSVVKPEPVTQPLSIPAPPVKPAPIATPSRAVEQSRIVLAPPVSTASVVRKPAPPPTYNRSPLNPGTEGTEPVTPQTPLKAGEHLHGQYEGRWYAVTVVESLDDGNVRVRWDTWGKDIVGSIPRARLRLPAKK